MYNDDLNRRLFHNKLFNIVGDWKVARDVAILYGAKENDLFEDCKRSQKAQKLITRHIDKIANDSKLVSKAWLLVQHMDQNITFQIWFLDYLEYETEDYKFLYDRIAVNSGQPQKYNTQIEYKDNE